MKPEKVSQNFLSQSVQSFQAAGREVIGRSFKGSSGAVHVSEFLFGKDKVIWNSAL